MRVAVVGMGKMGVTHAALLSTIPSAELVGTCDRDPKAGSVAVGAGLSAPFYTSLEALIEEARPEAVFICLPSSANLAAARACVSREVHIFVEKPLANTLENAELMLALAREHPELQFAAGFMGVHIGTFAKAYEFVRGGRIGDPIRGRGVVEQSLVFSPQQQWLFKRAAAGGGAAMSIGSHCIVQLQRLCGPVGAVESAEVDYVSGNDVEDGGHAMLRMANGAEIELVFDWSAAERPQFEVKIDVEGSRGRLRVSDTLLELDADGEAESWHISELPDPAGFYLGGDGYALEDEQFVAAAAGAEAATVGWDEALQVQRVVTAIYRAAEAGGPVAL